jgi:hypothetical protein
MGMVRLSCDLSRLRTKEKDIAYIFKWSAMALGEGIMSIANHGLKHPGKYLQLIHCSIPFNL